MEKLKAFWINLIWKKQNAIRKKIRLLVWMCSGISLIVFSAIMFYGTIVIGEDAIKTGEIIGDLAVKNSTQSLESAKQEYLTAFARERSILINDELEDMREGIKTFHQTVTKIVNSPPSEYSARPVPEATPNDGDGVNYETWIFYAPDFVENQSVRDEIGALGNLQEFMIGISGWIGRGESVTTYIASVDGFIIETDNKLPEWAFPDKNMTRAQTFDFYERPWFKEARIKGDLFFTHPYAGGREGNLAISCAIPYYKNGQFAGVVGMGYSLDRISQFILNTKIESDSNFCFVLDNEGHVLFSQMKQGVLAISKSEYKDLRQEKDQQIAFMASEMLKGKAGTCQIVLDDKNYIVTFAPIKTVNWSLAIAIENIYLVKNMEKNRQLINEGTKEQVGKIRNSLEHTLILMIAATIFIMALVSLAGKNFSEKLTKPLLKLSDEVQEIAAGNLDKKIEIRTGDEMEKLATNFNAMTSELKTYMENLTKVAAEKEKIATELNLATNIQLSMLPNNFDFDRKDFEIYATMNAARSVGGDFYDFYLLDENHLVITIADVSGKGVPAALFMAASKIILKNFAMSMQNPDDLVAVMTLANNQLCQENDEMMFVTVFMGMLDLKTGRFIFVNGGHNPPMIYNSQENSFSYLQVEENCVLGLMGEMDYIQQEINLNKGDIIYLYTDGVTEAMDENNNQYGETRLSEVLNETDKTADLPDILEKVSASISKHVGNAEQSDDITMLIVRLNPNV